MTRDSGSRATALRREAAQPEGRQNGDAEGGNRPILDLDEARLRRLLSERQARAQRLAQDDAKIAELCKRWGEAHGYKTRLNAEQVLRAIEAER